MDKIFLNDYFKLKKKNLWLIYNHEFIDLCRLYCSFFIVFTLTSATNSIRLISECDLCNYILHIFMNQNELVLLWYFELIVEDTKIQYSIPY